MSLADTVTMRTLVVSLKDVPEAVATLFESAASGPTPLKLELCNPVRAQQGILPITVHRHYQEAIPAVSKLTSAFRTVRALTGALSWLHRDGPWTASLDLPEEVRRDVKNAWSGSRQVAVARWTLYALTADGFKTQEWWWILMDD